MIVTVGAHAGEVVPFDIIPFFRGELRLSGSKNAPVTELRIVMNLVAEGKLKPVIHRAFPLGKLPKRTVPQSPGRSSARSSCFPNGGALAPRDGVAHTRKPHGCIALCRACRRNRREHLGPRPAPPR